MQHHLMDGYSEWMQTKDLPPKTGYEKFKDFWSTGWAYLLYFLTAFAFIIWLIVYTTVPPRRYCGEVTQLSILPPVYEGTTSNSVSDAEGLVIFHSDSLGRNIALGVRMNTYANLKVGQRVCFTLSEDEIR